MSRIIERVIDGQFVRHADDLTINQDASGRVTRSLDLMLGYSDTTITRTVLPDGSYGDTEIVTQETAGFRASITTHQSYLLEDGRIVVDPSRQPNRKAFPVPRHRKIQLLTKIALGRVDNWKYMGDEEF